MVNFFTYYRVWQTSGNLLLGSRRFYGNHCARYKINSVTSKRWLKTQIFDNEDSFSMAKIIPADFYRIIEYKKPQGTNYGGLQGFLTVIVQDIGSFLWDL